MNLVIVSALLALSLVRPLLAKYVFNILDPNDSGKSSGLFLIFSLSLFVHPPLSNLFLTTSNLLTYWSVFIQRNLWNICLWAHIYRLITFHILTLKPASVKEGLPFLLPVPFMSTSLRLNIHFFQPSFSVGLCIWSFYINDTIWQWISGKGTISSGWEYRCIESQDLAGTLKNRDLRASLLMDALCSFLSMMPCPCSAGSLHQRAQLLWGKFLCTAQDFTPSWLIPTSSFRNHLSIRLPSLNVFHLFPAGDVISMAHP